MASVEVKRRRGTTVDHSTFTGAEGETTVDTTKDTVVVHDGVTAGGYPLLREDLSNNDNVTLTDFAKTLLAATDGTDYLSLLGFGTTGDELRTSETDADALTALGFTAFMQSLRTSDSLPTLLTALGLSLSGISRVSGEVATFAMNTAPSGWLKCNGAAVSRTTYADLYAAIGTTFGSGDGSTTFNLPDMRGEFARGWDDGRGVDTGRALGSSQGEAFKAHTHTQTETIFYSDVFPGSKPIKYATTGTINTGSTGGAETRPRNIALLYCIKT